METTKYALITAATSGIGLELAKVFEKDNYNLVIVAKDEQQLGKTVTELKEMGTSKLISVIKDIGKPGAATELYDEVKAMITIEVLANEHRESNYEKFIENGFERELDII